MKFYLSLKSSIFDLLMPLFPLSYNIKFIIYSFEPSSKSGLFFIFSNLILRALDNLETSSLFS